MNKYKYLSKNEKLALDELIQLLRKKYDNKLKAIKLFGSKMRGDFDNESDIDLFLVFDFDVDWKFKDLIYDLVFELNLKYDIFISCRIHSSKRLKDNKIRTLPFIKNVVEHGIDLL